MSAFGPELFNELRKRDWLTLDIFSVLGTGAFAQKLPAYGGTHHAVPTWDIEESGFSVGT